MLKARQNGAPCNVPAEVFTVGDRTSSGAQVQGMRAKMVPFLPEKLVPRIPGEIEETGLIQTFSKPRCQGA